LARANFNSFTDIINELSIDGKKRGILHIATEDPSYNGQSFQINGKDLLNFGTCGYLGLETDQRLIEGAISYASRFGTQFSVSRTFLNSGPNVELEEYLRKIFGYPVAIYSSTSGAHISVIPVVVNERHAIILDQQVHMSVQTACQLMVQKGVPIEMIKHNNMEMLERKINELGNKYEKIWYMVDGVYSMFGDVSPVKDLLTLMDKYEQLHVYVDDAHGIGWYGDRGAGYFHHEAGGVHPKMILIGTLAKGYGVTGGVAVFPNNEVADKVLNFGGPLTYSHPLAPPLIGAAIESAKILLSDELPKIQGELKDLISYTQELLDATGLPVINDPRTPIYFVGMGQPKVGYNMVHRLHAAGYYVNVGIFPAVPIKNTGVRFTISRHQNKENIKSLVEAIEYHYPRALAEEGTTDASVRKAFHLPINSIFSNVQIKPEQQKYIVQYEKTIRGISQREFDELLGKNGSFDYQALLHMEESYSGAALPEDNWDFHYFIIRDNQGTPVLATFFTSGIYKDDLLAHESVSLQIEEKRKTDPYFLTSVTLAMGSLISEGIHLYIDRDRSDWKEVLRILLREVGKLQEKIGAANIMLRDFDANDEELKSFLLEEGYFKVNLPNTNVVSDMHWDTNEEFVNTLSARSRAHVRRDVFRYEHFFDIESRSRLTSEELDLYYDMYLAVRARNYSVNYFPYPRKVFRLMNEYDGWEFNIIRLKKEYAADNPIVSICANYKTEKNYCPMTLGMDYRYNFQYNVYRQSLFQMLKRARELGYTTSRLGYAADIEKHKFGAQQFPRIGFMQANDNFNFELIETFAVSDVKYDQAEAPDSRNK
jgi:7-keto-8-aminopelargonate synthetase-like enzyme